LPDGEADGGAVQHPGLRHRLSFGKPPDGLVGEEFRRPGRAGTETLPASIVAHGSYAGPGQPSTQSHTAEHTPPGL
jgi:hypothetical protein